MYIDPNATAPTAQATGAAMGRAGSSLDDIVTAANNGTLRVDPATGDATIRALTDIQREIDQAVLRTSRGSRSSRLGGGYAEEIDRFNREWTESGEGSADGALRQFQQELLRLEEAVRKSMATYEAADAAGVRHLGRVNE